MLTGVSGPGDGAPKPPGVQEEEAGSRLGTEAGGRPG